MAMPIRFLRTLIASLDAAGPWLGPLGLRLLLAYEFWGAGMRGLGGPNAFAPIHATLMFPFDTIPVEITWPFFIVSQLVGAVALLLGLGTRVSALALSLFCVSGMVAAQAGPGEQLSLFYLAMLLPLILSGPGMLSLDHWIRSRYFQAERRLWS